MKILDIVGLALLTAAGVLAWLPLGLAIAGGGCLLVSRSVARGSK